MTVAALHPYTIGGSEAAAVVGRDPFLSAMRLGATKLGLIPPRPESEAMQLGTALEEAHVELVAATRNVYDVAAPRAHTHPDYPWMVGHPDAFVTCEDGTHAVLELKLRGVAPDDKVKVRDTFQVMHYLAVTGLEVGVVSTLHGGWGGWKRTEDVIVRDDRLIARMIELDQAFLDLVRQGRYPAPDGSADAHDALKALYPGKRGEAVRATQQVWADVKAIRVDDEIIEARKAHRALAVQRVQAFMGDATELVSPYDTEAARWRPSTSTRVDVTALRKARPEIAAEFSATTVSRRFEVNP